MTSKNRGSFAVRLLFVFLVVGNFGCGGGSAISSQPPPPPLTVTMSPSSATVQEGLTQHFMATVYSDPTNEGVTWALSCSVAGGCGSLSATCIHGSATRASENGRRHGTHAAKMDPGLIALTGLTLRAIWNWCRRNTPVWQGT